MSRASRGDFRPDSNGQIAGDSPALDPGSNVSLAKLRSAQRSCACHPDSSRRCPPLFLQRGRPHRAWIDRGKMKMSAQHAGNQRPERPVRAPGACGRSPSSGREEKKAPPSNPWGRNHDSETSRPRQRQSPAHSIDAGSKDGLPKLCRMRPDIFSANHAAKFQIGDRDCARESHIAQTCDDAEGCASQSDGGGLPGRDADGGSGKGAGTTNRSGDDGNNRDSRRKNSAGAISSRSTDKGNHNRSRTGKDNDRRGHNDDRGRSDGRGDCNGSGADDSQARKPRGDTFASGDLFHSVCDSTYPNRHKQFHSEAGPGGPLPDLRTKSGRFLPAESP